MIVEIEQPDGEIARFAAKDFSAAHYMRDERGRHLIIRLHCGAIYTAADDNMDTLFERLNAALGGMPLHIQRLDPIKRQELRGAASPAPPIPPVETQAIAKQTPHGQIIVEEPAQASDLTGIKSATGALASSPVSREKAKK